MTIKRNWTGLLELENHLIVAHRFHRVDLIHYDEPSLEAWHERAHQDYNISRTHDHPQVEQCEST